MFRIISCILSQSFVFNDEGIKEWKKLRWFLVWIKTTNDGKRVIGASNLKDVYMWIDAAYAVHPNIRSRTGGAMSLGTGIIHSKLSEQKLNNKISVEAELVGMSEYLPYNILLTMFLGEQGHKIENNIIYQDNQSAMRMKKNGRNSCTGNS